MNPRFFKAPPEAVAPITYPPPPEDGETPSVTVYVLDRAADPDGNAGGFDWYAAVGDEAVIASWASGQPLELVTVADLPNPLPSCPAALVECLPPQAGSPDYLAFWDALLVSSIYWEIRSQALTNPGVLVGCAEFVAAFADAKAGRANVPALRACISNLLAAGTFTPAHLEALGTLLSASNLLHLFTLPSNQ